MSVTIQEQSLLPERQRLSANYAALRDERDRGLDLATRQRLRIRDLTVMLRMFVEAAESEPPSIPAASDVARARALIDERGR